MRSGFGLGSHLLRIVQMSSPDNPRSRACERQRCLLPRYLDLEFEHDHLATFATHRKSWKSWYLKALRGPIMRTSARHSQKCDKNASVPSSRFLFRDVSIGGDDVWCGPDHMQMRQHHTDSAPANCQVLLCTGRPATKLSRANDGLGYFPTQH